MNEKMINTFYSMNFTVHQNPILITYSVGKKKCKTSKFATAIKNKNLLLKLFILGNIPVSRAHNFHQQKVLKIKFSYGEMQMGLN